MTILWIDFETKSRCDLKAKGVYNYAQDASTDVLCMSYAFDDGEVVTWLPGQELPPAVRNHTGLIYAHNAAFERLIFWYVLQINFKLEQFYCTAAQARANCAPGSLEDVGRFAGASMRKDHRGSQLIRLLSLPRADGSFNDDPKLMAEMVAYCEMDVKAMRSISQALRPLSDDELADYHVNERINDRGLLVDVPLCNAAIKYAGDETAEIQQIVLDVTEGAITSVRSPKMREWVLERVGDEAKKLMWNGEKYSIDKTVRANLLAMDDPAQVPPDVAEVIQCADDLWSSSVAKFKRLADLADEDDGRVRGAFVFAGGAATGRAASYGAQVHNLPRKTAKDPDAVRAAMVRGHALTPHHGARVNDVLKGMLRPAIVAAPGNVLIAYDWSAIEGRVHPWLSDCFSGNQKLDVFRSGLDPYKVNAAATFRVAYDDVSADQRQQGKIQELSLGFLGGAGAFEVFGRAYGLSLSAGEVKRAVDGWRKANPWAQAHGQQLEQGYMRAMRNKNHEIKAARITYLFDGQTLWYALPSGRVLCYPNAKFDEEGNVTYTKAAWKPAADAKEWPRARLWRGLACIAKGTPVLTSRGWVAIDEVQAADQIWDGIEWVSHDGLAHQGLGRVSYAFGVAMTADHLVLTSKGWQRADQTKGCDRAACQLPVGYETDRPNDTALSSLAGRDWGRPDCGAGHTSEVFDLINCGPRRRFVVQGVDGQPLIVHNCENVTQAAAHDILRGAMRQIPETIAHVHDEIVGECKAEDAEAVGAQIHKIMCTPPAWALDLPLAAEGVTTTRYS